jgi:D-3-phosphoglycerate dehydrogenase
MEILVNDLAPSDLGGAAAECQWVEKERIYREADIITLHVPLTGETENMIRGEHLEMMKSGALLINTARGGIINEDDLYMTMLKGHLGGAAIDVFKTEPYFGPLVEVDHCVLTAHMGSMTEDCRTRMEIEATEEVVRFISGQPLQNTVPEAEYEIQSGRLLLRGQEIQ